MTKSRLEMDNSAISLMTESIFVCDICNRNFIKLHRLKSHLRTHKQRKISQANSDAAQKQEYWKKYESSPEKADDIKYESHIRSPKKRKHVQEKITSKPKESSNISSVQLKEVEEGQERDNPDICQLSDSTKNLDQPSLQHTENNDIGEITYNKSVPNQNNIASENCVKNEIVDNQDVLNSGSGEDNLECDICGRNFKSKCYLDRHYLTHTKEKPHICEICGKGFAQKGNLNVHYLTHSSSKNYVCYVCDKSFAQMGALKAHLLTHSTEMPYSCNECGRQFTSKCFLDRHYLIHTGEKPHKCNICNKGFAQLGNLNVHYLTHTKEKLFFCAVCNKGFSRQCYAVRHLATHSREQVLTAETL